MTNVAATEVNNNAIDLTCKLVAFLTSRKLVLADNVRALVGEHNLIMQPLNRESTTAILNFAEANGTDLGGWLSELVKLEEQFNAV